MDRPPVTYIIQIDNFHVSEFLFYWMYYNQPCSLLIRKPKTEGLTAIQITVENDEAAFFLFQVKEKTGCRIYNKQ